MAAPNRSFLKYAFPSCRSCSACFAAAIGDIFLFFPLPILSLPLLFSLCIYRICSHSRAIKPENGTRPPKFADVKDVELRYLGDGFRKSRENAKETRKRNENEIEILCWIKIFRDCTIARAPNERKLVWFRQSSPQASHVDNIQISTH
ncbi:evolutionarily conserved C-terminal region 7 [Striga asiatica]|uniref:Evolutionarily conserved C-terminal region 7 n=1 Tax=Striga asiatica TaxID=4170 RepID=A0A5A7RDU1_STRAF|nr:evolutionarily conserved C-terminal region 7 [Striga asiatica]